MSGAMLPGNPGARGADRPAPVCPGHICGSVGPACV